MELINNMRIMEIIAIASKHKSINRIGIFGSYARGESIETSDIDILYDYDDSNINDTIKCLGEILKRLDTDIDFVAYEDLVEVKNEYDVRFRDNVLKDVVWIYNNKIVDMKSLFGISKLPLEYNDPSYDTNYEKLRGERLSDFLDEQK